MAASDKRNQDKRDRKKEEGRAQLGIYVHIPFCVRKCNYCDFLSGSAEPRVQRRYVEKLIREIGSFPNPERYRVVSVFFGGGTPSLLAGEEIGRILEVLGRLFPEVRAAGYPGREEREQREVSGMAGPEITIECNPGTLTKEKLEQYRKWGINRLSIGLQSSEDRELRLLGRIHTWQEFLENYRAARAAGFSNINIDLMSGLPGQSPASWRETLGKVLALKPEHISAYSLMVEEGTVFAGWYGQPEQSGRTPGAWETAHLPPLPSEDEERQMYYDTEAILKGAGMKRYEISNYAMPGYESIHNSGYWMRREYAGFGLGASSQLGCMRYKNTDTLEDYLQGDFSKKEVQQLTRKDEMEETMFLGLRMMQGVDREEFFRRFQIPLEEVYPKQIPWLKEQGLVEEEGNRLRLTSRGIDVSNGVLAEFLLDETWALS